MATKYITAIIFTKNGNLNDFLYTNKELSHWTDFTPTERAKEYYGKEREIQLILLTRYEGNKLFCKIKCPVNPLPIKGEFEVPSYKAIYDFLVSNGWSFKQKFYPRMFE